MSTIRKLSALPAVAACFSLVAMPAQAAELPVPAPVQDVAPDAKPWDGESVAENHRYRRYRGYRHRNRVDAGDVFAGVLILGGIAAIASAAKKDRDERYRDRDYRYRDYRYRDRDYRDRDYRDRDYRDRSSRYDTGRGIDRAVDMCLSRIERDVRVDTVDEVERDGSGWEVKGRLYDGESFTCKIGSDGRIEDIDYDGADFDDGDRFSQNDEDRDNLQQPEMAEDEAQRPAYPGGPLPGEEEPGEEV